MDATMHDGARVARAATRAAIRCVWYQCAMSTDKGRKVPVQVVMTEKLLESLDEIAETERHADETKPNRSRVIRRFVTEGLERATKGAAR